jgi:hypothetical protein
MELHDESKDAITRLDITLHDKSVDITKEKLRNNENIYGNDESTPQSVHPDIMETEIRNTNHGKSYDLVDGHNTPHEGLFLEENTFAAKGSKFNHSATVINNAKDSIVKKSSSNIGLTSIDNLSNRKSRSMD